MPLTVEQAEKALAEAISMEREIAGELAAIETALTEAESTAGERSLTARKSGDQKTIGKINDEIGKLRSRRDVTLSTHGAAREAIKDARHGINVAKAGEIRTEAAKLGKEIEARGKKTRELLAALHDHEGVGYMPEPLSKGGAYLPGSFGETKTARLTMEHAALIQRAEALEKHIVRIEPAPSTGDRVSGAISTNA